MKQYLYPRVDAPSNFVGVHRRSDGFVEYKFNGWPDLVIYKIIDKQIHYSIPISHYRSDYNEESIDRYPQWNSEFRFMFQHYVNNYLPKRLPKNKRL